MPATFIWDSYFPYWQMFYCSCHLLHQSFIVQCYCHPFRAHGCCGKGHDIQPERRNLSEDSLPVLLALTSLYQKVGGSLPLGKFGSLLPNLEYAQTTRGCTNIASVQASVLSAPSLPQTSEKEFKTALRDTSWPQNLGRSMHFLK